MYWSIFLFFINDIDVRRRYTKKVHPLKAWPLHHEKKKKRGFYGMREYESKVSVDADLKQLKVISRREDGGWK